MRTLSVAFFALVTLSAVHAGAQDREESCPEYFDYRDDITALLEGAELAGHEPSWDALFNLRREDAGWRLDFQFRIRGELWRETRRGTRCNGLMEEAVLVLERRLQPRERFVLHVGTGVDAGSSPAVGLAGQLGLGARFDWATLIVRAQLWGPTTGHAEGGVQVDGLGLSAGLLFCGRPHQREIAVDLCVGASAGGTSAQIGGEKQWAPAVNLEAEAAVERRLNRFGSLRLSATLLVPVLRPLFDFGLPSGPIHITEVIGVRFALTVALDL